MEQENFKKFLDRLAHYYDRREFFQDKTRNNQYFSKVKHIPGGEVLDFIFDQITDQYEYIPKNLPKAIRAAWGVYKSEHPDKIISGESGSSFNGCKNCKRGWINFIQTDEKTGIDSFYSRS